MSSPGIMTDRAARTGSPGRLLLYGGVLATALAGTCFVTRESSAPGAVSATHDHASVPNAAPRARAVSLTGEQARRIGVTYATAIVGPIPTDVRTIGQVTYDETRVRAISARIDGFVERLYVGSTGQPVSVGQPLLGIYSPMLVQAQEELLLAKRLADDLAGGSADARRGAADLLASARRRLAYWDIPASEIAAIEASGEARRTLTLRSPAAGHVLEKNVVSGQRIMAGELLYRVVDLSTVWVEGEVFEQDLARVHTGQTAHADFQALPGVHYMGRIAYIYPTVDPETRTARVRVVLPNREARLKPGMYATLRIAGAPRAAVLSVPRGAVLATGERTIVFVRDGRGALVPREVTLGAASDDRVEILRGLTAGETVVASATFLIDAESNLGAALGGMGDMPGMEVSTPPKPLPMKPSLP